MSLFKKLFGTAKKIISSPLVRAVAPVLGGPVGMALGTAGTAYGAYQSLKGGAIQNVSSSPAMAQMISPGMSYGGLSGLGALIPGAGRLAGVGMRGVRTVARSAQTYCRRHPAWCATIGGVAAVEALISNGQLPPIKRSRGRGISATELRHFKRVARFTSKYCAPVRKAMKAPAMRRGARCN